MAVVFLSLPVATALAQSAPAPAAGTRVAVIDISYIFKNHPGFKQQMESMKAEVQAFEGLLRQRAEEINKLQGQLQGYKPNSAEYKQIETKILKIQADGQAEATMKKKDFLQRESKIYYTTYNEIVGEVRQFADRYGISMVVRFNMEPMDEDSRNSVLEGVNCAVVYQRNLNITEAILKQIQHRLAATQPAAGAPGSPAHGVWGTACCAVPNENQLNICNR